MQSILKLVSLPVLALTLGFSAPAVHADEGMPGERLFQKLNLTAEQKQKIKEIRQGSKEKMQAERKGLRELRQNLKAQMKSDASEADLLKQFSALQAKTAETRKAQFEKLLQIRAVLTVEQRKQFAEMSEKRRGDRRHKRSDKSDGDVL